LHLESTQDIYQQVVVADSLLEVHQSNRYEKGGAKGANQMPVPRVPWETQQRIYVAPALQGFTSKGLSHSPVVGSLPTMRAIYSQV
jgi:hypothetical protein